MSTVSSSSTCQFLRIRKRRRQVANIFQQWICCKGGGKLFVHFSGRCLRLKSKKQVPNDIHQSFPQNLAERKCEAMLSAPYLGGWLSGADRLLQRKLALKKVRGHMAGETRARAETHALMCLEPAIPCVGNVSEYFSRTTFDYGGIF